MIKNLIKEFESTHELDKATDATEGENFETNLSITIHVQEALRFKGIFVTNRKNSECAEKQ